MLLHFFITRISEIVIHDYIQDLILNLAKKVEKMENTLIRVCSLLESLPSSSGQGMERASDVKQESAEYIVSKQLHPD